MKRERAAQIVLVLAGLMYLSRTYPCFDSLWQSNCLQNHQDAFPMFTSVNATLERNVRKAPEGAVSTFAGAPSSTKPDAGCSRRPSG